MKFFGRILFLYFVNDVDLIIFANLLNMCKKVKDNHGNQQVNESTQSANIQKKEEKNRKNTKKYKGRCSVYMVKLVNALREYASSVFR